MTLEFLLWKRHKNEECIQQLFQIYLNWCLIFQYPSLFTCLSTVKQGQVQPNTVHYRQVQPSTSPPPPSLVSFPDRSRNIRLGHYFANPWRVEVAKWETRNLPCRRIWNMSITNVYYACLAWFWHHIKYRDMNTSTGQWSTDGFLGCPLIAVVEPPEKHPVLLRNVARIANDVQATLWLLYPVLLWDLNHFFCSHCGQY